MSLLTIILAIIVFGSLIFFHELGHYFVAKLCDIKVNEFAIGMGPKIFGFVKGETLYSIRAIPLGGYVQMEGEDSSSENSRAFSNKPVWQRLLVVVAGASMNFIIGFILMLGLVIFSPNLANMTVVDFMDGSVSSNYGIKVGDKILKIDNYKLRTFSDFNYILVEIGDRPVNVVVKRNNETLTLNNVRFPFFEDPESGIKIANLDFKIGETQKNFLNVFKYSFDSIISNVKAVEVSLKGLLITKKYNIKAMAGPIQIIDTMSQVSALGAKQLIKFVVVLTVNLGVLNLLPGPALDGGKIFLLLIELVRRKPINPKWENYINMIGYILLILLFVVVFYNDVLKILHRYRLK